MKPYSQIMNITPVIPSADIIRDANWYDSYTGFKPVQMDDMYAVLKRDNLCIHLQWHANIKEDPLLGGSVIKIFVNDIYPVFEEFMERGTLTKEKLRLNRSWKAHEFGFYDPNNNAIFVVQDLKIDAVHNLFERDRSSLFHLHNLVDMQNVL